MSRLRHLLWVVVAAVPLLAIVLSVVAEQGGSRVVWAVVLWAVGVAVLAGAVWRETILPLADVTAELGTANGQHARWKVRELREQAREVELERSQLGQLLEDVTSGLGEGLLVVTSDLRVRLANPRALHFFAREKIEPGSHLLDLLRTPDAVDAVRKAAGGEPTGRVMVENPRGLWDVRPFPLRQGGAVVLLTEVGLVRRSAELRRRFVQDLSHELRSPLAVVRTTVEAMEGEIPVQMQEMMIRQVDRLTRLTDELFELATIEAGQLDLNLEQQPVAPVIDEVVNDFASVAEGSGVTLAAEAPEGLSCTFDRRGLSRVLSNLVDNAIKYNRRGGWVNLRAWDGEGVVHIEVADSGEGIPASELQAVLQRFYRIDRARTPGRGGLGLGLAIVKHMVQHMGGTLNLDSREGVGTRVVVTMPVVAARSAAAEGDAAAATEADGAEVPARTGVGEVSGTG